jgi:hypothetical protein
MKEICMTIIQRTAIFAAALIYASITIGIIATPVAMAELSGVVISFGNTHF